MRKIPDIYLALPVLINLDNGTTGSGFIFHHNSHEYLVTAKHVLYTEGDIHTTGAKLICQDLDPKNYSKTVININFEELVEENRYFSKECDVCALKIGTYQEKIDGKKVNFNESKEVLGVVKLKTSDNDNVFASLLNIKKLDDVLVSNDILVFGYPNSLGLGASAKFDNNEPLLRKGIVANVYPKNKTLILDCPVYGGNSGGPVIQIIENVFKGNEYHIIGVVSEMIPHEEKWVNLRTGSRNSEEHNSGYSIAVSMDVVLDMLGITKE